MIDNSPEESLNPLRTDITDMHYAQLFFVVGHTAIKMLSYIEQMESDLKKQGNQAANEAMSNAHKGKRHQNEGSEATENNK